MQEFHASSETVFQSITEAGIESRWRLRWKTGRIQHLVDLYLSGVSVRDCAAQLQTGSSVVCKYLAKQDIQLRPFDLIPGTSLEKNGNWKGGRSVGNNGGYISVMCPKGHPRLQLCQKYIPEHHLVMEMHIGRHLLPDEVVHHKDKNKQNNKIGNLVLFSSNGEHLAHELAGQCPKWSEEGKKKLQSEVLRKQREGARKRSHSKSGVHQ
jgi:hypothetical protein